MSPHYLSDSLFFTQQEVTDSPCIASTQIPVTISHFSKESCFLLMDSWCYVCLWLQIWGSLILLHRDGEHMDIHIYANEEPKLLAMTWCAHRCSPHPVMTF